MKAYGTSVLSFNGLSNYDELSLHVAEVTNMT
jgi:hypothetical protein